MTWARAAVIGASGGIGAALANHLAGSGAEVFRFSRGTSGASYLDLTDEASIADAAQVAARNGPLDLVIVASGYLHGEGAGPEKPQQHHQRRNNIKRRNGNNHKQQQAPCLS